MDRCFFFFSSRRRHTRYWRDWSSDVCSSDLEKPENRPEIDEHLEKLRQKWLELADVSKQKECKLNDAKRQEDFNQGVQTMNHWVTELETTVISEERATDLTTATRLLQKHKVELFKTYIIVLAEL